MMPSPMSTLRASRRSFEVEQATERDRIRLTLSTRAGVDTSLPRLLQGIPSKQ